MWKKILSLTAATTISLTFAASAFASSTITANDWVKMRSQPSTNGSVYFSIPKGTNVQLIEKVNSYWFKVSYNGKTGYVSTNYFNKVNDTNPPTSGNSNSSSNDNTAIVSENTATVSKSVSFRSEPNTNSTVYSYLKVGTVVKVIEKVNSYWLKVEHDGKVGYASTSYFSNINIGGSTTPSNPAPEIPNDPIIVSENTATVSKSVSFRSEPNTNSTVYSYIKAGTIVKVIEKVNSYWLKVEHDGKVGYASTSYFSDINIGGSTTPSNPAPEVPNKPENVTETGQRIVDYAKQYLGRVTYKYGVNSPSTLTMDCSAFIKLVYKNAVGIDYKWGSNAQEAQTMDFLSKNEARIGDLLFFRVNGSGIGHVGIYMGNGQMIHNTTSGGVIISPINSGYWNERFIVGGRGF